MGSAPRDDPPARIGNDDFVYDVFAIALDVTVNDHGSGGEAFADHHRREQIPFLARVKVAVDVGQIPVEIAVNGAMENQRRSDGTSERRTVAIPGIVVASGRNIRRNQVGRDVVSHPAVVAAYVNFFAIERFVAHVGRGPGRCHGRCTPDGRNYLLPERNLSYPTRPWKKSSFTPS